VNPLATVIPCKPVLCVSKAEGRDTETSFRATSGVPARGLQFALARKHALGRNDGVREVR
jgi:hypothetical protein